MIISFSTRRDLPMGTQADDIKLDLNGQKIRSIENDAVKSAEAVDLIYVTDEQPGVSRKRRKQGFEYYYQNKKVTDKELLKRIKSLVIPPAWEKVWICPIKNGHLQVTGYDTQNRKQYRYHDLWVAIRRETKFYRLRSFGQALPSIRRKIQKDLKLKGLPRQKVLAALISLMEETNIRIGNTLYEKLYGSFGLSTFRGKHLKLNGAEIRFIFKGKKGIHHDVSVKSRKLAHIVRRCREIPGKELFHYYDENKEVQKINSEDVNEYIRTISGSNFTSKDFRTWAGSVECIRSLKEIGFETKKTLIKKNIVKALDMVSERLGNTRSICKKYYVHPRILICYENGILEKWINTITTGGKWFQTEEKILMKILKLKKDPAQKFNGS